MEIRKFTKKKDGMYKLQFDEFSVLIHEDLILKHQLLINKHLSIEELDAIRLENNRYEVYNEALKYIKRRLRSVYEVRTFLSDKAISSDNIDFVCDMLEKQGYLNDKVYAISYVHDKMNMSLDGPQKIKNYLASNMVDDEIIIESLKEFSKDIERDRVEKIISKNVKTNKTKSISSLKMKLKQNLINLGYSTEIINSCLNNIDFDDSSVKQKEYEKIKRQLSRKYSGKELEYKIKQKMYQKGFSNLEY